MALTWICGNCCDYRPSQLLSALLSVDMSTVDKVSVWPGIVVCSMTKGIYSLSVNK